ncbi:hypothetical protein [Aeromonas jandaei]|uniref:hypothetical protein n=1 Tax=Aeromonas jandaei TaxID=650 RepID=UPI003BA23C06
MSALDPVILGEVSKVSAAVAKLSAADSVLLDIPVRPGHSFSDGDIALYDTERGDLHDGRGEIIEYFSPASYGTAWIAKSEQAPAVDERPDGSLLVAALFRDSGYTEGTTSSSQSSSLEIGYRKAGGQFIYAKAYLPTYYLQYSMRDMRLIPVAADEYFLVFVAAYSSSRYVQVCSVRIVSDAPVIGAFTAGGSGDLGAVSTNPLFLLGANKLIVYFPDSSSPKTFLFTSAAGVITVSVPAVVPPAQTAAFQIDSNKIIIPVSSKLYRFSASGAAELVDVTLDVSDFATAPSYTEGSGSFSLTFQGYPVGSDIIHGIFCPLSNDGKRVYINGIYIGGFTVTGQAVKVHPPYSDGGIGYDRIFYKSAIPIIAMHPLKLAGVVIAGTYALGAAYFMKRGYFVACSTNRSTSTLNISRASVRGKYVEGGVIVARQSGKSAIAPIGAGGKVIARKYDPARAVKNGFTPVGVAGLLDVVSVTKGRLRYPDAAVKLVSYTGRTASMVTPVNGPIYVEFLSVGTALASPGVKLWICEDGVWSVQKVARPTTTLDPMVPSLAFKGVTYLWDDVRISASLQLDIGIYDGVVA